MERDRKVETKVGKGITKKERRTKISSLTRRHLHIEVVMAGIVGMQDKLLHQVTCRVKQDILKNKKSECLMLLLRCMFYQTSLLQPYLLQTVR